MPTPTRFSKSAWNFDQICSRIKTLNWAESPRLYSECLLLIWILSGPVCLSPGSYWLSWNVIFTSLYIMYKLENEKCVNNIVWNKPGLVFFSRWNNLSLPLLQINGPVQVYSDLRTFLSHGCCSWLTRVSGCVSPILICVQNLHEIKDRTFSLFPYR